MAQIQCPNCGGYKLITEKQVTIATELRPVRYSVLKLVWAFVSGIALGGCSILVGISQNNIFYTGFGIVFVLLTIFAIYRHITGQAAERVPSIVRYDLYCQLCGYRWTWQTDRPYPRINLNPALIQQGEQRLEEEANRRQRDMEAAWWASQQNKK